MDDIGIKERLELWRFKREGARDALRIINRMELKSKKKKDILKFLRWLESLDTLEFDAFLGEQAEFYMTPDNDFIIKVTHRKDENGRKQ